MIPVNAITDWKERMLWRENFMDEKMQDPEFIGDSSMILRPDTVFSPYEAYQQVRDTFIEHLPGRRP